MQFYINNIQHTVFSCIEAQCQLTQDRAAQERTEILLEEVSDDLGYEEWNRVALPLSPLLLRLLSQLLENCRDEKIGVATIHPGLVHHHTLQPPE